MDDVNVISLKTDFLKVNNLRSIVIEEVGLLYDETLLNSCQRADRELF